MSMLMSRKAVQLACLLCLTYGLAANAQQVPERKDIADKYKWDLSASYKSDADFEADLKAIQDMIPRLKAFEGKISQSAESLLEYYKLSEQLGKKFENAGVYASMAYDQDTRDQKYTGYNDRISSLGADYSEATAWFSPELLTISPATFEAWYKAKPELAVYRHAHDNAMRSRAHVLSTAEERILALSGEMASAPGNANTALRVTDIKFPSIKGEDGKDVQLSEGRVYSLMLSPDARVRREASIGLLTTYGQYKNTAAALMSGNMDGDLFYSRARHYNSCLHASLDNDNIDTTVYLNLIQTVKSKTNVIQRYVDLRRRALKQDSIHFYDMLVPLIPENREKIPYDDAVKTVIAAMAPLGKDYIEPMTKGFSSRWIDVYETTGKEQGAYSTGSYLSHPYMLLNYSDTMEDMFTVAHEMGHSMHTWHTWKYQPYAYANYTLFNAEIASTFNEALLMDYLLKKETDPKKRLQLVNQYIDNIRGTVITQVMFADFELQMHRAVEAGEPLTAETLGNMYLATLKSFYGNSVVLDPEYAYTWIRIPHFYRNFYVYKYATSFCASQAMAQRVLNNEKGARESFIRYLSSGSSKYPMELVKDAGVDLTTPASIEATMTKFGQLVDELEVLLKQTKRL